MIGLLKRAFIEGYKQRAEGSALVFDENSEIYAEHIFEEWIKESLEHNVSKRLFDVTYQGQDADGLIVRTITVQAENASEAAEKVRQCGLQLKIYSSNAC